MAGQTRRGGGQPPGCPGARLTADQSVPTEPLSKKRTGPGASGGHAKRLSGDVAIYGSGRIALQLLAFFTLPVLTHVFTNSQYGVIETATTVFSVVMLVAPLGLESASQRSYFDYSDEQVDERRLVLGTTVWAMSASGAFLGALLIAFSGVLSQALLGSRSYAIVFVLTGATVPLATLLNFTQEVLRLRHRPAQYVALALFAGVMNTAATLFLILVVDSGVKGVVAGTLIGMGTGLLVGYPLIAKSVGTGFSRPVLRTMLAYGLPFIPVAAATWAIQLADRFFLLAYFSTSELGIYSLGAKYANLLMLAVYAFGAAWAPFFLDLHSRDAEEERRVRAKALSVLMLLLTWGAIAVTASSRAFIQVFTSSDFRDAYKVIGLLSVGIIVIGMNSVVIGGISIARKTHYFVRYTAYAAAANIALNFALIPPLGMVGAAIATLLTYVVLTVLYSWRAQRLDPVDFNWDRIARILIAGALCMVPANLVFLHPLWLEIVFKSALIVGYPLVAFVLGGVDADALTSTRAFLTSLRRRQPGVTQ
ncbi:MAG: polysaccharide biosynthesis C-terminal domain-containing protein [Actinomycetota bacterium]